LKVQTTGRGSGKMIQFEQCTYHYSKKTPMETVALQSVNLTFEKSQLTALMGRTGSGKTTMALLAAGLLQPTGGDVWVDGLSTRNKKTRLEISRKVGVVFQYPEQQFFCPSVGEEIEYALKNFQIDNPQRRLTLQALEDVGLNASYLDRNPFQLSGGEQRLVAIASIIVYKPSYLFFDEPTAGLDALAKKRVYRIIKNLVQAGKGIYLITHDVKNVKREAERLIVLHQGRVYYQGLADGFFTQPYKMEETGIIEPFC